MARAAAAVGLLATWLTIEARYENQRTSRPISSNLAEDNWALDRLDGMQDGRFTVPATGAGVHIYILDSGVRTSHVEFAGRAVALGTFTDTSVNPVSLDVADCDTGFDGHGTHDGSYAAGARFGVASGARLHVAKVSGGPRCDGSPAAARRAIDYLVAQRPRGIVTISFAWPDDPRRRALVASIGAAMDRGFVFTLSAACTADVARTWLEAATEVPQRALIVAATDEHLRSVQPQAAIDYGPRLSLFAPGNHVLGASGASDRGATPQPPLDRTRCSDSFAAPHAAGVAAIYLQQHPDATPRQVHDALVGAAVPGLVSGHLGSAPNRFLRVVN